MAVFRDNSIYKRQAGPSQPTTTAGGALVSEVAGFSLCRERQPLVPSHTKAPKASQVPRKPHSKGSKGSSLQAWTRPRRQRGRQTGPGRCLFQSRLESCWAIRGEAASSQADRGDHPPPCSPARRSTAPASPAKEVKTKEAKPTCILLSISTADPKRGSSPARRLPGAAQASIPATDSPFLASVRDTLCRVLSEAFYFY